MDEREETESADTPTEGTWVFGRFSFEPASGTLHAPGGESRLRRQSALTLELLLENAGQVVPRDHLRRTIWPDRRVVDFDMGIAGCIREIRSALGESAREPHHVETLRGRGFRLHGDVVFRPRGDGRRDERTDRTDHPSRPLHRGLRIAGVLAAVALTAVLLRDPGAGMDAASDTPADGAGLDQAGARLAIHLAEGAPLGPERRGLLEVFREEVLGLAIRATQGRLDVLASSSVEHAVAGGSTAMDYATSQGATLLLIGRVADPADELELELLDLAEDRTVWEGSLDVTDLAGARAAASRTAAEIAAAAFGTSAAPEDPAEVPPQAEVAYLKGRLIHEQAGYRSALMDDAAAHYEEAVAIAPAFTAAWEALAEARYWGSAARSQRVPAAIEAAERALELDPDRAEAHRVLGLALGVGRYEWERAEDELRTAWQLAPYDHRAQRTYGLFLISRGRVSEGLGLVEAARVRDPISQFTADAAMLAHYYARHFERAARLAEIANRRPPNLFRFRVRLFTALYADDFERARAVIVEDGLTYLPDGRDYGALPPTEAVRLFLSDFVERFAGQVGTGFADPLIVASFQVALGRHDDAIETLSMVRRREAFSWETPYMGVSPHFDPLAGDPRFQRILQDMDLPPPRGLAVRPVRFWIDAEGPVAPDGRGRY